MSASISCVEELTYCSPSTCGRTILSSRVVTSMSTSAGKVVRHWTSCSNVSCARDCSSRLVVSLLAYLSLSVTSSLAQERCHLQAVPEGRHDLVEGDESVQNHTLRVPALLRVFGSAITWSCCSPTRHVTMSIVQHWRLTCDVFDIGMKWSAQVKTAPASQRHSQQVSSTQT